MTRTYDLPNNVDLRKISVTPEQIRFAIGASQNHYSELAQSGAIVAAIGDAISLPADVEIDMLTCTQKQFAAAVNLTPARINQLVSQGVLVTAPACRNNRLMFFASLENFLCQKNN